jgi:hypothetical protein
MSTIPITAPVTTPTPIKATTFGTITPPSQTNATGIIQYTGAASAPKAGVVLMAAGFLAAFL